MYCRAWTRTWTKSIQFFDRWCKNLWLELRYMWMQTWLRLQIHQQGECCRCQLRIFNYNFCANWCEHEIAARRITKSKLILWSQQYHNICPKKKIPLPLWIIIHFLGWLSSRWRYFFRFLNFIYKYICSYISDVSVKFIWSLVEMHTFQHPNIPQLSILF